MCEHPASGWFGIWHNRSSELPVNPVQTYCQPLHLRIMQSFFTKGSLLNLFQFCYFFSKPAYQKYLYNFRWVLITILYREINESLPLLKITYRAIAAAFPMATCCWALLSCDQWEYPGLSFLKVLLSEWPSSLYMKILILLAQFFHVLVRNVTIFTLVQYIIHFFLCSI